MRNEEQKTILKVLFMKRAFILQDPIEAEQSTIFLKEESLKFSGIV